MGQCGHRCAASKRQRAELRIHEKDECSRRKANREHGQPRGLVVTRQCPVRRRPEKQDERRAEHYRAEKPHKRRGLPVLHRIGSPAKRERAGDRNQRHDGNPFDRNELAWHGCAQEAFASVR
jgi:hypothetical protein